MNIYKIQKNTLIILTTFLTILFAANYLIKNIDNNKRILSSKILLNESKEQKDESSDELVGFINQNQNNFSQNIVLSFTQKNNSSFSDNYFLTIQPRAPPVFI